MSRKAFYNRFRRPRQSYIHVRELGVGRPCPYCNAIMTDHAGSLSGLVRDDTATRDHVVPRSLGGKRVLIVCNACNHEKADLGPQGWLRHLWASGRLSDAERVFWVYRRMGGVLPEGLTLNAIVTAHVLVDARPS